MRFAALHLAAYGPFDRAVLDFERPAAGLQLVHGPNERGKSTALRAVHALLFGFPQRTEDGFGRDYAALRVGAVLDDGVRRLALMRRKGTRHTLFEFEPVTGAERPDRVVDPAVIDALLGGVDERRFRAMHGLDAGELRERGKDLLRSDGDLGAVLFAAASGLPRLRAASAALKAEAEALFLPNGRIPKLNAALAELEAREAEARAAGLRPRDWAERRDALERTDAEVARLEATLHETRARSAHVERLIGLRPQLARLESLGVALRALADAPLMPADAGARLAAGRRALADADAALAAAAVRRREIGAALADCVVSQPHLDAAAAIVQLAGRLDAHEATRLAMPGHEADTRSAQVVLHRALAAIDPRTIDPSPSPEDVARAAAIAPSRGVVAEARQRLGERRTLEGRLAGARAAHAEARRAADDARAALAAVGEPPDAAALLAAVDAATADGDLGHRASTLRARLESIDRTLSRQAEALGSPDPDALARLRPPAGAELERAESDARAHDAALAALQARRDDAQAELGRLRARRDALATGRAIVGRDALQAARATRDALLDAARRAAAAAQATDALEALAPAVREADRIADARFDDAARLADIESLSADLQRGVDELASLDAERERAESDREAAARERAAALQARGLPSLEPAALRDWAAHHARLLETLAQREVHAAELRAAELDAERHLARLNAARGHVDADAPAPAACAAPDALGAALADARRRVAQAQAAANERARLEAALARDERELDRGVAALAALEAGQVESMPAWAGLAAALRLPADAGPDRLEARLAEFEALREAANACEAAQRERVAAAGQLELFVADAAALARRLGAATPAADDAAAFVESCRAELVLAERAREERLRLAAEGTALATAAAADAGRRDAALAGLASLAGLACIPCVPGVPHGPGDPAHAPGSAPASPGAPVVSDVRVGLDALAEAIEASERRRSLQRDLAELEALVRETTGAEHDALVAQAAAADPAALAAERDALARTLAEAGTARDAALAARTQARTALDAVDGDAAAAHAAEAALERRAAAARLAGDWARLRLARELLEAAVQRHAQRAQGPLLASASRWFARLTAGRWRALRPDLAGDAQVLLAERDDGVRLRVDQLSEGTADALYLALRLAAIDVRLAAAPPVPLLLDDVLASFDDERAALALEGLAELGQRNQVVYFTHHAHLVAIARRTLPPARVGVVELERGAAPARA